MMPFEKILQHIKRFVSLTADQEADFCQLLTIRKLKRREFLLREGQICMAQYFVNEGCLREYCTDPKLVEHSLYFAIEDGWISDVYSRTYGTPSFCNIVAQEDSELVEINYGMLEQLMGKVPALERFFRLACEGALANQNLRTFQMVSMTAEERYIHFMERYPELAVRIPQKHIATFLGLTPQFFNTVHAKVSRSKRKTY